METGCEREFQKQWASFTRQPYCPERLKKLCFTTLDLAVKNVGARLDR